MKIAASMSVGRLAPKHSLNIDNIRVISKNVTPKLIKNDVILIDRLKGQNGKHMTIEEYTDQHFQPYIDQYNAKQRRKDRQIQTGYCEWHRGNGTLSQGKGELAYEAVLQYGTHEDIGGEYYAATTSQERNFFIQSRASDRCGKDGLFGMFNPFDVVLACLSVCCFVELAFQNFNVFS